MIRLHEIRHTTATLLKNLGVPARDVQLILGHADISTTQEIYQHDDMGRRSDALGKLAGWLFSGSEDSGRCRQFSRQPASFVEGITSVLPGAEDED